MSHRIFACDCLFCTIVRFWVGVAFLAFITGAFFLALALAVSF